MKHSLAILALLLAFAPAGVETSRQSEGDGDLSKATLVYIGTYTGEKSKGIYVFRLQSAGTEVFQNVTLVPLGLAAEAANPSFFELDLARRRLFTVNEVDTFEGKGTGAVTAFSVGAAGRLTMINQVSSKGARPCHLALDKDVRHALVANCSSGTIVVLPIAEDGRMGEATDVINAATACVAVDPSGQFALACNQAADKVLTYRFDAQKGKLTPAGAHSTPVKPGSGPRQIVFRPDGRFAYVLNEKTSTITVFAFDAASGTLTDVQTVSTLPEYFDGPNAGGELRMHHTGRWLYASNRGHNSVVLLTVDKEKGTLTFVEEQGTGAFNPKFFGIEPSSKHLAISNVDSDKVLASRIDEGNGRLKPSGIFAEVASPASIRFLPPVGGR